MRDDRLRSRIVTVVAVVAGLLVCAPEILCAQEAPAPPADSAAAAPLSGGSSTSTLTPGNVSGAFSSTIEFVTQKFSQQSGKNIVPRGKTPGQKVSLIIKDMPLERALDQVVGTKPNWIWYKPQDQPNTYEIWDQESFRTEVLPKQVQQKVFMPREITAEEAHKSISGILTPNIGQASYDPRSNKVIVTDLLPVLELAQRLLEAIDVKFITRVFYIAHANVDDIKEKLANLKSPAAPAPEVDVRTHLIIVRDRLDIIRQMELLVSTLDVGPELRVYDLNNLGWDGVNRQEIEDLIERVKTPDALSQINVISGKLLVEDIPEVHEKIEKILAAFDQPAKQVLVQCEIIETTFQEGFNWSVDYTLSGDLFSSVIDKLTGNTVPTSGNEDATVDNQTLGFIDFRKEFPLVSMGSTGLNAKYLSRHAFVSLTTAMSDSRTRILQQPYMLIKNQAEGSFTVGVRIPYYSGGSYGNYNNNQNNQYYTSNNPQLNFAQSGLDLIMRPSIMNNGLVELEVEISNNAAEILEISFAGQTYSAPQISTQELITNFIVPSGETRMIGGLLREASNTSKKGIPGLVKIPVVGPALFGSYNKPEASNGRRNLLLFITPTIVAENPSDLHKYKGRVVVDENAVDSFTTPSATLADMQFEAPPISLPEPLPEPIDVLPSGKSVRGTGAAAELEPAEKQDSNLENVEEIKPEVTSQETLQTVAPEETTEKAERAPATGGFEDLRHVRVKEEISSASLPGLAPSLHGPSGVLTGPEAGKGASTPAPQAASTPAPTAAPTPKPATPTPQPPVVVVTPVGQRPSTETRM